MKSWSFQPKVMLDEISQYHKHIDLMFSVMATDVEYKKKLMHPESSIFGEISQSPQ